MSSPDKFYVTTPIYYVNARPHIGHAYTTIVADVVARRHRLLGERTWFLTGTDEHGQKIERSAAAAGIPPQAFADEVSASFRGLWDRMGLTYDQYIRTTDEQHKRGVQKLFADLYARGEIYLSSYTGQYSVGEEMFVDGPPGTIGPDGRPTETVTEENFFFRLSNYQLPLLNLIESGQLAITPEARKNEVLSFLRGEVSAASAAGLPTAMSEAGNAFLPGALKDLSVSRSSFTWGIPVPEPAASAAKDPHVIYVWLDALANYMTALGYGSDDESRFHEFWPADLHLVGKEIIRFHCVYWPAFLLAAGLPLPKSVVAHGWLLFEESKMSKSRGNIVRTETILEGFGDHYRRELVRLAQASAAKFTNPADPLRPATTSAPDSPSSRPTNGSGETPVFRSPEPTKAEADLFASDVLRYFLLREIPFGQDGSFSFDAMITRYNADLVNGYGNLVSRSIGLAVANCNSQVPELDAALPVASYDIQEPRRTVENLQQRLSVYSQLGRDTSFDLWLTAISDSVGELDGYLTRLAPWKLFKTGIAEDAATARTCLYMVLGALPPITACLYPFLPYAAAQVWKQLGFPETIEDAAVSGKLTNLQWGGLKPGTRLGPLAPIFPRAPKELAQIMTDMETKPSLTQVTADNDAATSERSEFAAAPLSDAAAPTRDQAADLEPTSPAAPPRTSTLPHANPGSQVGASSAPAAVLPPTPSHVDAEPSGVFAGAVAAAPITAVPDAIAPQITIDDFAKVELRVAKILVAERIPKADKLLRLEVDLGPLGQRQILSGIAEWYTPDDLVGRKIVVITNLAPRKMRGLESHGMLLAASHGEGGKPVLATFAEEIEVGTRLK